MRYAQLPRVVPALETFRLRENAEKRGIAIRGPMAEDESADKHGHSREQAVEEIEGSHGADADEVEKSALNTEVRERLVQALVDSVSSSLNGYLHR
jgi:hypothetical protein